MKLLSILLLLMLSTQFVSCTGGVSINDPYTGWYDSMGFECGNLRPGCNYWFDTGDWADKITADEDPYYTSNDPSDFEFYGTFTYDGVTFNDVWVSRTGIIYDSWTGESLNKITTTTLSRDVLTNVAEEEDLNLHIKGSFYAKRFGLSQDQGFKIAETMNDFNTLSSRSENDVANFAQRLYGVDFATIKVALSSAQQGDVTQLNSVIDTAAKNFGTTPESMKKVVESLHSQLLDDAGIVL